MFQFSLPEQIFPIQKTSHGWATWSAWSPSPAKIITEDNNSLFGILLSETNFFESRMHSRETFFRGEDQLGSAVAVLVCQFVACVCAIREGAA